jgi:hypothetical protein
MAQKQAQKQAQKASRHASSQPPAPPERAIVRQGAQRSVRDAITTLGDIPILRPQPQQPSIASVDNDGDDDANQVSPSPRRVDSVSGSPIQTPDMTHTPPSQAPAVASASPTPRTLHLPFRFRRSSRGLSVHSAPTEHQAGGSFSSSTLGPQRQDSGANDLPSPEETGSPPGLRGGGNSRSGRKDVRRASQPDPSSSHQDVVQDDSEEGEHDWLAAKSDNESPPTLYLQGYWTDVVTHPQGPDYKFRAYTIEHPQTEPRRRNPRTSVPPRSHSYGNLPEQRPPAVGSRLASRMPPTSGSPSSGGLRTTVPSHIPPRSSSFNPYAPAYNPGQLYHPYTPSTRPFSNRRGLQPGLPSGADIDAAESYTEPRAPSSSNYDYAGRSNSAFSNPRGLQPGTFEYGPGPRLPPSFGYTSSYANAQLMRPSTSYGPQDQAARRGFRGLNTRPGSPSTAAQFAAQYGGASPLPSFPYTRAQPAPAGYSSAFEASMDATTAAMQNLPSPLEPYSNHYQQHVIDHNARQMRPAQPPIGQFPTAHLGNRPRPHNAAPPPPSHSGELYSLRAL